MKMGRIVRLAAAMAIGTGLIAAGTAATQALDPEFLDCFGLMIVDPTAHGQTCITEPTGFNMNSLSPLGGGAPPVTPTVTPTVV